MPEQGDPIGCDPIGRIMDCAPRIRAWLGPRLSDPHDADDLAQETLVAAWRAWPGFRGESSLSTWMHGIAKRLLWRHCRARGGAPIRLEDPDAWGEGPVEPSGDSAGEGAFGKLCLELMAERLPPADARLFNLFYGKRLTVREIARELRMPEGTVKYRLFSIRASLRGRA